MSQLIIFKLHSVVDIITNSSSEIFVCPKDTKHTANEIKDFIAKACALVGQHDAIENIIKDPWIVTEDNFDEEILPLIKAYNLQPPQGNSNEDYPTFYNISMEFREESLERREEIQELEAKRWMKENYEKVKRDFIGCVVIQTADDNTIPYELWELIERFFDAQRRHLG